MQQTALAALAIALVLSLLSSVAPKSSLGRAEADTADPQPPTSSTPHTTCTPLPAERRFRALGFELGGCIEDVRARAGRLGLTLEGGRRPYTPPGILPYGVRRFGGELPVPDASDAVTFLMFDDNMRLFAVRTELMYKNAYQKAKEAFDTLDRMLDGLFGEATVLPFTKRWVGGTVSAELKFKIDAKSNSTVAVSFFLNELAQRAGAGPSTARP